MTRTGQRARGARGTGHLLRDDLVAAATVVLEQPGGGDLSLRAVAKVTGVSPNAVYLQFADKDALILAVLDHLFRELADERDRAEQRAADLGASIRARVAARSTAYVDWAVAHPGAYRVLYGGRAVPQLRDPTAAAFGQSMLDRTTELIRLMRAAGETEVDPAPASLLLWCGLHGIASLRIDKNTFVWPDAEAMVLQMLQNTVPPRA